MSAQFQIMRRIVVTVTTAGTPVQVNSGTALYVRSFLGQAHHANTGKIFVGDSSTDSLTGSAHALNARESFGIDGDVLRDRALQFDLSQLWINSDTDGQKFIISYMAEVLNQ